MKAFPELLVVALCASVVGCKSNKSPATIFTPDNVHGTTMPGAVTELTPDQFEAKVRGGDLTLMRAVDEATARRLAAEQFVKDRAFLEAIVDRSEALKLLLGPKPDVTVTPGGDFVTTALDAKGAAIPILTLGDEVMFRSVVRSYEQARDPANALAVYRLAYDQLTDKLKASLPAPDSLTKATLADLQVALANLDALLQAQPDPVTVQPAMRSMNLAVISGGAGAGAGSDNLGGCGYVSDGIFGNLNWPLKGFLPPIKFQGKPGTCWGFTAVGAIETRERVVNDSVVDLSEQYTATASMPTKVPAPSTAAPSSVAGRATSPSRRVRGSAAHRPSPSPPSGLATSP
jgi:Papain family cysteine protease